MRNPDRIDPFLERLGKVWKENASDWRFRTTYRKCFWNNRGHVVFYRR